MPNNAYQVYGQQLKTSSITKELYIAHHIFFKAIFFSPFENCNSNDKFFFLIPPNFRFKLETLTFTSGYISKQIYHYINPNFKKSILNNI